MWLGGVLPHINAFLFKNKSGSDDSSPIAQKVSGKTLKQSCGVFVYY